MVWVLFCGPSFTGKRKLEASLCPTTMTLVHKHLKLPHLPFHHTCPPNKPTHLSHLPTYITCPPTTPVFLPHLPSYHTCPPATPVYLPHLPSYNTCPPTTPVHLLHLPLHHTCPLRATVNSPLNSNFLLDWGLISPCSCLKPEPA